MLVEELHFMKTDEWSLISLSFNRANNITPSSSCHFQRARSNNRDEHHAPKGLISLIKHNTPSYSIRLCISELKVISLDFIKQIQIREQPKMIASIQHLCQLLSNVSETISSHHTNAE